MYLDCFNAIHEFYSLSFHEFYSLSLATLNSILQMNPFSTHVFWNDRLMGFQGMLYKTESNSSLFKVPLNHHLV